MSWISRPLDPARQPIDGVLALVHTISSDRPENPQLIAQSDARYLGRRTIDGVELDVMRYGTNTTYFVGVDDGLIHMIEASFRSFSDPVVVRLSDRGPRRVHSPDRTEVVDASTIPEVYRELTGVEAPIEASPPRGETPGG